VAERPILFSGPLVRAILAGRKTQTRRVLVPRNAGAMLAFEPLLYDQLSPAALVEGAKRRLLSCYSPYGQAGDRLWVRESFDIDRDFDDMSPSEALAHCKAHDHLPGVRYAADGISAESWATHPWGKPRPSIHMPRWASRIDLEVTEVRIERLQAITEEDARAEGVEPFPLDPEGDCWTDGKHRTAFNYLWGEINGWTGPKAWDANPWVWVVSFRVAEVRRG
jgi:hypothetical protein